MVTAIVLAGGLGTRLRTVISDVPKPMAPIGGKPFLVYQLDYWIEQGVTRFILSVGYKSEVIIDYFGFNYRGIEITYVQEDYPLGTGGGLLLATKELGDNSAFLLLNGDTYFAVDLKKLIHFSNQNDADWCFSLFPSHDQTRYLGMDVLPSGQIISFKLEQEPKICLANGGVYWIQKRALLDLSLSCTKLSLESDILPMALLAGQCLFGIKFLEPFIDIGVPVDYYRAADVIATSF